MRIIDARARTAILLFLPPAVNACRTGWTPSPASASCFLVPLERSTSLFHCVDLCEEHGGTPACIDSAEENDFVTAELAVADGLWLGLYQNETGLGPAKGWGRCVAGGAPSFTNWYEGQPDDYAGENSLELRRQRRRRLDWMIVLDNHIKYREGTAVEAVPVALVAVVAPLTDTAAVSAAEDRARGLIAQFNQPQP